MKERGFSMMKASIIIPVYNAEEYLDECINSALNQTMSKNEYEILLIDDSSTDNSLEIIKKYEDTNINLIIHEKNKGVSAALNTGLRIAKGKYVFTMACDDIIDEILLETCYEEAEKYYLDAVYFGCTIMYDPKNKNNIKYHTKDGTKVISPKIKSNVVLTGIQAFKKEYWFGPEFMFFFNKNFLLENELFFEEKVKTEDTEFMPRLFMKLKRMMKIDKYLYLYRIRMNSVSYTKRDKGIIRSFEISINNLIDLINVQTNIEQGIIFSFKEYYYYELWELLKSVKDVFCEEEVESELLNKVDIYISKYLDVFGKDLELNDYLIFNKLIKLICEELFVINKYNFITKLREDIKELFINMDQKIIDLKKKVLEVIALSDSTKIIAIYGIGGHTTKMIEFYKKYIGDIKAEIFFIDTIKGKESELFYNRPVINVKDINDFKLDCIVISSYSYEEEMYSNLIRNVNTKVDIYRFYEFNRVMLFK